MNPGPVESGEGLAREPDGYARLWTPHRMVYVDGPEKVVSSDQRDCPFCVAPGRTDEEGLIVHRGTSCFVVLNLYPYNPGHLMVCPYRHVGDLTGMTSGERAESIELVAVAMEVLRSAKGPQGFNLGMNVGTGAGAGIAGHAHSHVVPRWDGDANFLPIIGRTKAIPELLADTRQQLATAWREHGGGDGPG
ncbi:MAG: HIT family protein [Beutenbergiaceae bacterium]